MSEFLSVPVELLCHVFNSLTERIAGHLVVRSVATEEDTSTSQLRDNFTDNDSEETIFEEFDSPENSTSATAWKRNMPSVKVSLKNSAWFAFLVTVVAGGLVGLGTLVFMYYIISTVYTCEWKTLKDPSYPVELKRRRIIGESYNNFLLYFWQPAMLYMMFKWSVLKDVNVLTFTLIGASIDLGYRFFLAIYELYYPPWIPYPLNFLYITVVLINSILLGRNIFKTNLFCACLLGIKLCAQFIVGSSVLYIFSYGLFPWFARQEGFKFVKVVILALTFSVAILPKLIARQCALRLNDMNHPGTLYVLVSAACTGLSIVYRIMQAEFQSLLAFVALSIGHGLIHLAFELITTFKGRCNNRSMYSELEPDQDFSGRSIAKNTTTLRSQRLAADLTIHEMMSDAAALVLSVGIIEIYGFIHQNLSVQKYEEIFEELVARIVLALLIEFLFNIVSVMILTRGRNVPVLRVWNLKWKSHLIVCVISVVMIVTYCTDKLLVIIRARYVAEGKIIPEYNLY